MEKREVRAIAAGLDLAVADKPDSQDICFVPDGDYARVVQRFAADAAQPAILWNERPRDRPPFRRDSFTVGQRKGLGISGEATPLFVVALDAPSARVILGPRDALRVRKIALTEVNWLRSDG